MTSYSMEMHKARVRTRLREGPIGPPPRRNSIMLSDRSEKQRRKRLRRNLRSKAAAVLPNGVARCVYCGRWIVRGRAISLHDIEALGPSRVFVFVRRSSIFYKFAYFLNDTRPRVWLASIDHVIPISRGGDNQLSNLVPSCMPCNREQDQEQR